MNRRAFITGISGPELSAAEREFIRMHRPWGFILFKRNIETPTQVISLVQELRRAVSDPEAPVLIDQEGGRVQRLGPPHWPLYPAGAAFCRCSSTFPGMGEPPRILISGFRWSIPRKRSWNEPILPPFDRWLTCQWR